MSVTMNEGDRRKISDAATEVFEILGPYHAEKVYQNALVIELDDIHARTEETIPIRYKSCYVSFMRVDLTWKDYIVEVKTVNRTTDKERGQCHRYARCTKKIVVLLNFSPSGVSMEVIQPPDV